MENRDDALLGNQMTYGNLREVQKQDEDEITDSGHFPEKGKPGGCWRTKYSFRCEDKRMMRC